MVDLSNATIEPGKELMIPEPVRIKVGQWYQMAWQSRIIDVKVNKITISASGEIGVILSKPSDTTKLWGLYRKNETITIRASEIKDRLMHGGLTEITL